MWQLLALGNQVGEVVVEGDPDIWDEPELPAAPGDDLQGQQTKMQREFGWMPVLVSAEREAANPGIEAGKGCVWEK